MFGRSPAHAGLQRERESFVARCRDAANARGEVWVEKVKIETQSEAVSSGEDIAEALGLDTKDLRGAVLEAVRADLDSLLGKVPPGLALAREGLDLRDPALLEGLLKGAREELLQRLAAADADVAGRR